MDMFGNLKKGNEPALDVTHSATFLKRILSIFIDLKSLAVHDVNIGEEGTDWSDVAKYLINLERFSVTSCGDFNETALESLIQGEKLKELKTDLIEAYQTEQFPDLEYLSCELEESEFLHDLLEKHPKLTKIKCDFAPRGGSEIFENFVDLLPAFKKMSSLEEVDFRFNDT